VPHATDRDRREPHTLPALLRRSGPVWIAPMAGGASNPELVIAATGAGNFAQLAAGYKTAAAMLREVEEVRRTGTDQFGVNLFVPNPHHIAPDVYEKFALSLHHTAERLHHTAPPVALLEDDDDWDEKIAALVAEPVPVVSFTFGLPRASDIDALHRAGSILVQTVTTPQEASRAHAAGLDVLVVQGFAAGGHSGIWAANALPADIPLTQLVDDVASIVPLPLVATGGIATARHVSEVQFAGASAVAVGTAVLRSPESGATQLYKNALADPRYTSTTLTRAFTGRPARALLNQFVRDHDAGAPSGYPALHHLTRPLRAAALAADDASALNIWAGKEWTHSRDEPVATILNALLPGPGVR
jgi:nitronate monooxygenase